MCGICGVFKYSGGLGLNGRLIEEMRDTMVHRGPDDAGLYLSPDGNVGFGHRRLSIIDLTPAGHQPMANEDETIWITYNGEIYNHLKIRKDLVRRGHVYRSNTDTETILHLYEEQGVDFVHQVEGMFALAIWDSRKRCLVLIRDRLGIKPLYYARKNGSFIFASEIKAILKHPDIGREIDEEGLYHYLTFCASPAPLTLFKGIQKLAPGRTLLIDEGGQVSEHVYWEAMAERGEYTEEECIETIRKLLREATEKRMMSDVPFGAFLSGGIDSSINVAFMSDVLDLPVKTFSIGFEGSEVKNELEYALEVAQKFKTDHHEVMVDSRDIAENLPKMVYYQDDPVGAASTVSHFFVSKFAKEQGITVAQVGEGSDELFCGYRTNYHTWRQHENFWAHYENFPTPLRRYIYRLAKPLLLRLNNPSVGDGLDTPLVEKLRRAARDEELFWGFGNCFSELLKKSLLTEKFSGHEALSSYEMVAQYYRSLVQNNPAADYLDKMIYLDLKNGLAERLLMRVDKMSMAFSLEARVPFLDHLLVEFALSMPTLIRVNGGPKHILKKSAEGIIPSKIINRPKMGFPSPWQLFFAGELRGYVSDKLFNSRIKRLDFFDFDVISGIIEDFDRGKRGNFYLIWNLFTLFNWYDNWIEK